MNLFSPGFHCYKNVTTMSGSSIWVHVAMFFPWGQISIRRIAGSKSKHFLCLSICVGHLPTCHFFTHLPTVDSVACFFKTKKKKRKEKKARYYAFFFFHYFPIEQGDMACYHFNYTSNEDVS